MPSITARIKKGVPLQHPIKQDTMTYQLNVVSKGAIVELIQAFSYEKKVNAQYLFLSVKDYRMISTDIILNSNFSLDGQRLKLQGVFVECSMLQPDNEVKIFAE